MSLSGKVCLVTGASRGIGRGIALQLGQAGATVYITGRKMKAAGSTGSNMGGLEEVKQEIEKRGGRCIPVVCDHKNDEDIKSLFDQISKEQDGRLDVLVNNAYSAVQALMDNMKVPFWQQPTTIWDEVNHVGLRNHYICSVYAAKLMVPRQQGLIVNISSAGGLKYLFNVPYGVGKEACDRMAADCSTELRKHNVAFVSLWPGAVKTELIMENMEGEAGKQDPRTKAMFEQGESTEFSGMCIAKLVADSNIMKKSGRILLSSELGAEYGLTDIDGTSPKSMRSVKGLFMFAGWTKTAAMTPGFLKLPYWMFASAGHKF